MKVINQIKNQMCFSHTNYSKHSQDMFSALANTFWTHLFQISPLAIYQLNKPSNWIAALTEKVKTTIDNIRPNLPMNVFEFFLLDKFCTLD